MRCRLDCTLIILLELVSNTSVVVLTSFVGCKKDEEADLSSFISLCLHLCLVLSGLVLQTLVHTLQLFLNHSLQHTSYNNTDRQLV